MRGRDRLSARYVATAAPGEHHDGGGLYLIVSPTGAKSWLYRFHFDGRRRFMGLGSFDDVSLAQARDLRDEARRTRNAGRNPIDERRAARRGQARAKTFGEIADELLTAKAPEWTNAKHADQWRASLISGAAELRPRSVSEIDTEAVLAVLKPMWADRPESAARLRQRIEAVLDYAGAHGMRDGLNPARWSGHLEHLLAKRAKANGHHAAMPYADVPAFVARLRTVGTAAAAALEFSILTAARSGEVLGAVWDELDADARLWTIPADRMKAKREHVVPLAPRAVEIVEAMKPRRESAYVFPGRKRNAPLSHVVMAKTIARLGVIDATPHGFRSAFRDWAGDKTDFPREVAEAALAHLIGDKAEQAYRRGHALDKRRALMVAWGEFCASAVGKGES